MSQLSGEERVTALAVNPDGKLAMVGTSLPLLPNGNYSDVDWKTVWARYLGSTSIDTTPPVITLTVTGTQGNNGWYTFDVGVSWNVTDPESTLSPSGCGSTTVTADTAGTTFTCSATSAGGTASESVTVKRDATAPTLSGSRSPAANANGWNNTDVTVSFVCADKPVGCGDVRQRHHAVSRRRQSERVGQHRHRPGRQYGLRDGQQYQH